MKNVIGFIVIFVCLSVQPALCQMVKDTAPEFLQGSAQGETIATEVPTVEFGTVNLNSAPDYNKYWSHWCNVVLGPDDRFYFGIGDHNPNGTILLNAYDPVSKTDEVCIDSRNVEGLFDGKWHGRPDINPNTGDMYLLGFYRGQLVHYNIYSKQVTFHGQLVSSGEGFQEHTWDWERNRLYGVTGGGKLLVYDTDGHTVLHFDFPVTGERWEERSRLLDRETGIIYGTGFGNTLMQYNPNDHSFSMLTTYLDGSLRSWTNTRDANGAFWIMDRVGNLFKFFPEQDKAEHMGKNMFSGEYVTFIEISPGRRYLYYSPAHGGPVVQYDIKTNQKKIIAFLGHYYALKYHYHIGGFFGGALSADGSSLLLVCNGGTNSGPHPGMFHVHIPESERKEDNLTHVQKQEDNTIPEGLKLFQNYPNPFNPVTKIRFTVPATSHVSLKILTFQDRK
jgi:hypothetical protein